MSDLQAPPRPVVTITDDTTLDQLAETLALLNAEAKAMSRRGRIGTDTAEYRLWLERLDAVLTDYETKAHACPA